MFAGLFISRLWMKKNCLCIRCRILVIILILLSTFRGVGGVGQIGRVSALGRKNGSISENTERSRRGFLKKFEKYLILTNLSKPEFYELDNIKQCNYLKKFFSCLRKERSYKTKVTKQKNKECVFFFVFFSDMIKFFICFRKQKKNFCFVVACQIWQEKFFLQKEQMLTKRKICFMSEQEIYKENKKFKNDNFWSQFFFMKIFYLDFRFSFEVFWIIFRFLVSPVKGWDQKEVKK